MRVSACLIVKNEENTLGRCLDSIHGHVDEIIVVDTGSRDGTRDLARRYTDKLFEFPWRHDFAAARQFSFDRASGDWVFWVDADDVVQNPAGIRPAVGSAPSDVNCFYWKYRAGQDAYGNPTCEFWRERCVRNNYNFRWVGRVHEVLVPRSRAVVRRDENVTVVHYRDVASPHRNVRRNLEILQREYAGCRGRPSPRLLHCLGSEYADLGHFDLAIDYLRRYVRVSQWNEEKYLALLRIAELRRLQGRHHDAAATAQEALDLIPNWPNACFSLAETFYFLRDWPQVVRWAEAGQARPIPDTYCVMNPLSLRYSWIIHYTNALFHVGRVRDALEWTEKALAICPGEDWHRINRDVFSARLQDACAAGITEPPPQRPGDRLPSLSWYGPLFDPSGYAEEGREFVLGLDNVGVPLRTVPLTDWSPRQVALPLTDSSTLRRLASTPAGDSSSDTASDRSRRAVTVFHMFPTRYRRIQDGGYHIGRTMCETDRIPATWVECCNTMDEIWVPCAHNVETFSRSGVAREKLVRMPQGINVERYRSGNSAMRLPGGRRFNFLSVFEWSRRKGWDVLVRAFAAEFRPIDNVALIIKTGSCGGYPLSRIRQEVVAELRGARIGWNLPANIILFPCNLTAEQMPALYRGAHAFVLPSRGEGWGRPLMEAMLMGLPTIGPRWSGPLEFMNDDNSYLTDCEVVGVQEACWREAPVFRGHCWAEPSVTHLRRLMRQVIEDVDGARQRGQAASHHIAANFSREKVAAMVRDRLLEISATL